MVQCCQWRAGIAASQYRNPPFDTNNRHTFERSYSAVRCRLLPFEQDLLPRYVDSADRESQVFAAASSLDTGKPGKVSKSFITNRKRAYFAIYSHKEQGTPLHKYTPNPRC